MQKVTHHEGHEGHEEHEDILYPTVFFVVFVLFVVKTLFRCRYSIATLRIAGLFDLCWARGWRKLWL